MAQSQLGGLGGPINYYDMIPDFRKEALQETENRLGQAKVTQMGMQNQQMQRENQRKSQFYDAISNAKPEDLPALRRQFPDFADIVQKEIGVQGAEHAAFVNGALNNLSVAASSGDPNQMQSAIQRGAPALASLGVSPDQALQLYQQDPQQFNSILTAARMATLPMDKQFENQQNQQKIDETARSNRAGEAVQWAGNNIAQQNVNLRRMELDDKKYDRQIANETNTIKLADLQDKRQQNQQAIEQGKRDKSDSYHQANDTFSQTIDTANKVLNSPGFENYFGVSFSKLPGVGALPGTDAADTEALVNTLSSQGFLTSIQQMKGMGALSDAEGKKISSAIASLDSKQSDKSAKESIKTIINVTQAAQRRLQNKFGGDVQQRQAAPPTVRTQPQQQPAPQQQAGYSSLWGD